MQGRGRLCPSKRSEGRWIVVEVRGQRMLGEMSPRCCWRAGCAWRWPSLLTMIDCLCEDECQVVRERNTNTIV